ncbi:E3 ubiquitin-protein ligase RNF185-like [Actinia tenebrosa]|uniref:RING-type E3 ubiquitin transferase n=1 Tax=Actinia tenebrosa TaxID=6105 RepID=A0A6P8H319_ACTTE|nr:E3 ubiquitin-protein ligase RNF185-like [Actinia tenebrosa]
MATHSEGSQNEGFSNIPSSSAGATASGHENEEHNANFECNICLDTAKDAVISLCGHLFCWPCLHRWLETRPNKSVCPVCKAGISKDKVIPLFGRGSNSKQDPREKMPPRPQARRTEPENNGPFQGFGEGFQLSFGIGAFPFAFFTSTFANGNQQAQTPDSPQAQDEQFLSKLFLWVAFLFIFWLLIA